MIWHIFKKDWKLTWPLVLGVALLNLLAHITQYRMGHFGGNPALGPLLHLLIWSQLLGSILAIAAIVHQDPTPGVRQDWLVRPIKRSDLLFEKLCEFQTKVSNACLLKSLSFRVSISQRLMSRPLPLYRPLRVS